MAEKKRNGIISFRLKSHIAHGFNHGLDGENGDNRFNGLNYTKCNLKVQLV